MRSQFDVLPVVKLDDERIMMRLSDRAEAVRALVGRLEEAVHREERCLAPLQSSVRSFASDPETSESRSQYFPKRWKVSRRFSNPKTREKEFQHSFLLQQACLR